MGIQLSRIEGPFGAALSKLRNEVSDELLAGDTRRPFAYAQDIDPPSHELLVWTDATTGELGLSDDALARLEHPDVIAAIAHQVIHAIGEGPSFAQLEDQLLEEAITETLAQMHLADFVRAFGGELEQPPELFAGAGDNDLEVTRPTAANIAVERFGRLAAWLEGLDGCDDAQDLDAAALKWATRIKATPGERRFVELAREAAWLGGAHDDVGAAEYLEDFLRAYVGRLERSRGGFAELDRALDRAWLDPEQGPPRELELAAEPWRAELECFERVMFAPLPLRGAIEQGLAALSSPHVRSAARRTLDARGLLWTARAIEAGPSGRA